MKQLKFPSLRQTYEYDCGAKSLQAVLVYYGIEVSESKLIKLAKTNARVGTLSDNMIKSLKKFRLDYDARHMTLKDLRDYIDKKIPVMILIQAWGSRKRYYKKGNKNKHWVVAIGYNRDKIFFEDPYTFNHTFLKNKELELRWHSTEDGDPIKNFGIAVYGRKPRFNFKKILHMK